MKNYKTVYLGGEAEIVEKKSRFIATVEAVETEEEALCFIEKIKKKYWDARHNCFAYVIGKENSNLRCSDDGEPQGTAGKPMLDVIVGAKLCNICVVVTRYFGGTLLGTGGLVRAYSSCTKAGLNASVIIEKESAWEAMLTCDYSWIGKLQYICGSLQIPILSTEYAENATMKFLVPLEKKGQFESQVTQATSAKVPISFIREVYFAKIDGEYTIFDE